MEKKLIFNFEKETKGTRRYQEIVEEGKEKVIGTLYIRKDFLAGKKPEKIEVILKVED